MIVFRCCCVFLLLFVFVSGVVANDAVVFKESVLSGSVQTTLSAINDAIEDAIEIHATQISKTSSIKKVEKIHDAVVVINVFDKNGSIEDKRAFVARINKRYGSELDADFLVAKEKKGSFSAITHTMKKEGGIHGLVFVSIDKELVALASDSEKGRRALSGIVKNIALHELAHAKYDFGEAGAAMAQSYGDYVDITTDVAQKLIEDRRKSELMFSRGLRAFLASKENVMLKYSTDTQSFHKMSDSVYSYLEENQKRFASEQLPLDLQSGLFAINSNSRILKNIQDYVPMEEYASIVAPNVYVNGQSASIALPGGYMLNIAIHLHKVGYSDKEVRMYFEALIESGVSSAVALAINGLKASSLDNKEKFYRELMGIYREVAASVLLRTANSKSSELMIQSATMPMVFSSKENNYDNAYGGAPRL